MTKRVLFVCTSNSARSQMAEAFLRHYADGAFEAHSAGLEPQGIHPYTVQVMHELGLDLSYQRPKDVTDYLGKVHFGIVVTVCANADERCPTFPGVSQRVLWALDDPAAIEGPDEDKLVKFRQVRDEIDDRIRAWLEKQGMQVGPRPHAEGRMAQAIRGDDHAPSHI